MSCREVYLGVEAGQNPENDDKLMVASLMGGLSLSYSEVGVVHALSYGLSKVKGEKHCYANCLVFQHLEDYYPIGVAEFRQMMGRNGIQLPQDISKQWSEAEIRSMSEVAFALGHMWDHAIGADWKQQISVDKIMDLYKRM